MKDLSQQGVHALKGLRFIVSTFFTLSHTPCAEPYLLIQLMPPVRKWKAFTHRALSLQKRFNCCFCIVTRLAWCVSRPQTLGMCCGDVRVAVIPHYIIGGGGQVVRPDSHRQLNARGTQTSITSRSSIRHFDGVRLLN